MELAVSRSGTITWHCTTKVPLRAADGTIIGLVGTAHDQHKLSADAENDSRLGQVVLHIRSHLSQDLRIEGLATIAGLSVSQFERRFKKLFATTPSRYILNLRIHQACLALEHDDRPIGPIALELGFYDQAHFSRQFKRIMGMTPLAFRRLRR
ncbi:MAG: helix-turn-helix domain-containing protein [Planctomycetota bacterium]|jgi:AraC-like DNA-binding protein